MCNPTLRAIWVQHFEVVAYLEYSTIQAPVLCGIFVQMMQKCIFTYQESMLDTYFNIA